MPTKAPKRRASRAAAENLEPSDEEVQRAQKAVQDFIELIAGAAVEARLFDYTDEQWADIESSLLHLQPDQAALEKARNELVQAARLHNWELVDDVLGRETSKSGSQKNGPELRSYQMICMENCGESPSLRGLGSRPSSFTRMSR